MGRETSLTSLWTIITPRHTGCGDTPEEKGQEALDNDFHMRQGKAEAIQDYIKREEMMPLSLQNSTKRKRSEASQSSQKEARGDSAAVKKAIQQTIVARRREEVRDDCREQEDRAQDKTCSAGDTFHTLS